MTCSRFTSWSLPEEIDPNLTFNVVMGLEGYECLEEFPNPDYIFSGIADSSDYTKFRGWITTAQVDPGWTMTINQNPVFKQFYKDMTGLDTIPDVLKWKMSTGPADPEAATFTPTDTTPEVTIRVLKPSKMKWILIGATAIGLGVVGIVAYKKPF